METFKIFINFKTYPQGMGENALRLVRDLEIASPPKVDCNDVIEIIPIVQVVDLWRVKQETKLAVWVQHVDPYLQGKFTGWTNLEAVMEAGAGGTLINHSEHPIPPGTIKQVIGRLRITDYRPQQTGDTRTTDYRLQQPGKSAVDSGPKAVDFKTMVCAKTLGQMERLVKIKPDYIGFEMAELIGTKTSITSTNPKAIEHAVKICGEIPLIVGAGINSGEDLVIARKLGAGGVLISSAIVLAKDPKQKILELMGLN